MKINRIDLHKLRHEDARRAVINFIEDNWLNIVELEIVTGNSTKMKEVVIDILNQYKLTYQISRAFDSNRGYIVTWIN